MTGAVQTCSRCMLFPILSRRNITTRISRRVVEVHRYLFNCHVRRSLQTSASLCKTFEVPSRKEVEYLKELYPNPKCLIHDLLQPLVHSGVTVTPQIVVAPRLGGRFFRAKLQLHWPSKVTVSAVDSSVAGAEENAYLLACDLMKNMGLLYQPASGSMMPVSQDYILKILRTLHTSYCQPFSLSHVQPEFTFTTTSAHHTPSSQNALFPGDGLKMGMGSKQLWRTEVAASWPYCFDVISLGPSCDASEYAATLHTSIKLKALGLLSSTNHLVLSRLSVICSQHQKAAAAMAAQHFDPHYEIYSDASALGFGAYLMKKDDSCIRWLANAWSEHFPDCPRITRQQAKATISSSVYLESTFCELYAVVTACFTWKHKFVGQRVLVWTVRL